jgi:Ras-related protein Rab-5C
LESARAVSTEEATAYAAEAGLFFLETSAKTAANVNELFTEIARRLPKAEAGPRQPQSGIVLDSAPAQQPKKSSCCA